VQTARAIIIRESGGPEVLDFGDVEVADPGPTQVRVRVAAAGLNRADCLQRRGFYPPPPGVSEDVPGLELAGTVEAVGSDVDDLTVGDRVMGILGGGAMAELVVTEADELMRVPESLTLEEAAAIPEAFLTAYDAMVLQGKLERGQTVLLHAVASGVGTAGIQIARALGVTVVGTSRTAQKLERCVDLGLDHPVLVSDGAFAVQVLEAAPEGANVVLDTVGAAYLSQNVKVLAKRGRIIVIGLMGGTKGDLNLSALLAKRASIHGSVLRSRPSHEKAALTQKFAEDMLDQFASGALRPIIDETLPMGEIQAAHARMDANRTFGKLVLTW